MVSPSTLFGFRLLGHTITPIPPNISTPPKTSPRGIIHGFNSSTVRLRIRNTISTPKPTAIAPNSFRMPQILPPHLLIPVYNHGTFQSKGTHMNVAPACHSEKRSDEESGPSHTTRTQMEPWRHTSLAPITPYLLPSPRRHMTESPKTFSGTHMEQRVVSTVMSNINQLQRSFRARPAPIYRGPHPGNCFLNEKFPINNPKEHA